MFKIPFPLTIFVLIILTLYVASTVNLKRLNFSTPTFYQNV